MIAVVCHDAGGAEILSSYVRQHQVACLFVLTGPARRIFERKLGTVVVVSVAEAIAGSDWVLCGTSWQSDIEIEAIREARAAGKRSVAFLDHWVNYRERFQRGDGEMLPDELWVGDSIALERAREQFAELPVALVENPYFLELREQFDRQPHRVPPSTKGAAILFVCEPIGEHALFQFGNRRHWGYDEAEALRFFLDNIDALSCSVERITIRPHPAEAADKYDWARAEFDLPIAIGGADPLSDEIGRSDIVVGCNSMAMVVGLIAGKRVVSVVPLGGRPCVLPQPEIESMRDLIATSGL